MCFYISAFSCLSAITVLHARNALKSKTSAVYHFNATTNTEGYNLCYVTDIYVKCIYVKCGM